MFSRPAVVQRVSVPIFLGDLTTTVVLYSLSTYAVSVRACCALLPAYRQCVSLAGSIDRSQAVSSLECALHNPATQKFSILFDQQQRIFPYVFPSPQHDEARKIMEEKNVNL